MSGIQTVSIELPIHDMEEFDTYIETQIREYKAYLNVMMEDESGYYEDDDISNTKMLIDHYEDILTGLRSTYTDKNGTLRQELLDVI
jgi:hypothetical protein